MIIRNWSHSFVQLTGTTIGAGAYGSVEEVAVPGVICAAKKIHDFFLAGSAKRYSEGHDPVCDGMSVNEHPPPPKYRPVYGLVFPARLATASPRHGATAYKSARLARPRNGPPSPA